MTKRISHTSGWLTGLIAAALVLVLSPAAHGAIDGLTGASFNLTAKADSVSSADGGSIFIWGYTAGPRAQLPGPTLIVQQGATVTITLTNTLSVPTSIVFPGQEGVVATGGAAGTLTAEAAANGGTVSYSFVARNPGTYMYHSGTDPDLQIEMGLYGVIIVRPNLGALYAYNDQGTKFDREYLFLLSEMDFRVHQAIEFGQTAAARTYLADYRPTYWFINGRTAPDTMAAAFAGYLPTQPYNSFPRMHPGERVLLRVAGMSRDQHPFHTHGNHARVIARQGRLLESAPAAGLDLATDVFVIQSIPGDTVDAIFEWTGQGLGWDIYGTAADGRGHTCNGIADSPSPGFDPVTKEYCPDHTKPFPVTLPQNTYLTFGGFYSGSPFMGAIGALPPGEGGLNPNGGFPYMWHSHSERELTNNNIFPGGLLTMLIIEPPGTVIP